MKENSMYAAEFARLGGNIQTTPDLPVFNEGYDTEKLSRQRDESPFHKKERSEIDLSLLD